MHCSGFCLPREQVWWVLGPAPHPWLLLLKNHTLTFCLWDINRCYFAPSLSPVSGKAKKISQFQLASTSAGQSAFLHTHILQDKATLAPSTDVKTRLRETDLSSRVTWKQYDNSFFFIICALKKENSNYEKIINSHIGIKLTT